MHDARQTHARRTGMTTAHYGPLGQVSQKYKENSSHYVADLVVFYFTTICKINRTSLPRIWFPAHSNITCTGKGVKI